MASPSDQEDSAAAAAGGVVSQYFPCIEQPTRVTLHCNGYYLWCKKNGKLICRKKRNEKDEFILKFDDNEGTLSIQHYKYKGILTVVQMPTKDGKNNNNKDEGTQLGIRCKKDEEEDEEQEAANLAAAASNSTDGGDDEDDEEEEEEAEAGAAALANTTTNASNDITTTATNLDMEQAQKWCFIKGAPDSTNANAILLKSLATGMNLGIHEEFQKLFFASDDVSFPNRIYWNVECSTGELCFLSNHSFSSQIQDNKPPKQLRCDMAGMLSMDTNRKGWEVFRFMESGHGFVKISSWMHSQWLLCSTKDGKVSTCSHAESFRDYRPPEIKGNEKGEGEEEKKEEKENENKPTEDSSYKCCNWAIEKSPNGDGVIIRSKTHGRLLSIFNNGELRTYDPSDDEKKVAAESASAADAAISPTTSADSNKQMSSKQKKSWKESMRSTMDGARKSFITTSGSASSSSGPIIPQAETTVWQLDAAHSQTYYFLSLDMVTEKAKSIGPGLQVTSNLRKNTKIQLIRNSLGITKMKIVPADNSTNNAKKKGPDQYIACHRDGTVSMVLESEKHDPTIEWVMEKSLNHPGFTAFRSKAYDLYLTSKPIKNGNDDMYDDIMQEKEEEEEEQSSKKKKKSSMSTAAMMDKMNSFIGKDKKEVLEELFATEQSDDRWKLDPCMPRAVSSDKIKAFAIGTTIAVGTTVAMPFALAGVAGIMGAIGAEVGTFTTIVFAGLTGAEAIASVGAIGATAYIVFKPAENSLTDDHKKEEEMEERAWSKRPFSNWRDW
eukprot:scaffold2447_cov110-Cylindrotheca_fusiformis.AAC.10